MIFELYLTLCVMCIGLVAVLLVLNYQNYRKHQTTIEKFAVILQIFIAAMLVFFLINLIIPEIAHFQTIIAIGIIAFFLTCYGYFTMFTKSGVVRPKLEKIGFSTYLAISSIVTVIIFSLNVRSEVVEGRIYLGLDYATIIIPSILFAVAVLYLGAISIRNFLQIFEEKLRTPMLIFLIFLFFYLASLYGAIIIIENRIVAFSCLIAALIGSIILNRKYPDLLVQIGTTFAFKSLFIIQNNGSTLYSYEFEPSDEIKDRRMIQYLIGGFIYAITHGIKEIIKQEYDTNLRVMDFERMKMLFYYGEHVFGVLFSREANREIYKRLRGFIDDFEKTFQEFLEEKTGRNLLDENVVSEEDKETVKKITELLKNHFKGKI